jgi:hypothetical protein
MGMSTTPDNPATPLGVVASWWRRWKDRRKAVSELECCGSDEVGHIARDIGISPAELRTLAARWPDSADLLPRRITAVGLNIEQIGSDEPQVRRDLERVCAHCADRSRCARDLDRDSEDRGWRDYCPNVATIDELRSEARDRRLMRRGRPWRSF